LKAVAANSETANNRREMMTLPPLPTLPAGMEDAPCICGAQEVDPTAVRARDELTGAIFEYRKCAKCGVERCTPRPDPQHIGSYYPSDYAAHVVRIDSSADKIKRLVHRVFWAERNEWGPFRALLQLMLFPLRGRSLLAFKSPAGRNVYEFGAASGNNLAVFLNAGWKVSGCEPSPSACARAAKRGISLSQCTAEEAQLGAGAYSCVLINHVLEHVHRPQNVLQKCHDALTADGVLIVALPNHEGFAPRLFHGAWPGYDAPRHLWGFSASSLTKLLTQSGFTIEHVYHEAAGRWSWSSSLDGRHGADPVPAWRSRFAKPLSLLLWPLGALAAGLGRGDFIKVVARRAA
jgi:SAM-dependent methyltransferase